MSDAAAGLTPEQEAIKRAASAEAAQVLAAARREREELYAREGGGWRGAMAVGRAAHPRDEARAEEAARLYLGWVEEDRQKRAASKGSAA